MCIAIVGGNECMVSNYQRLCNQHQYDAKIFTKITGLKKKIGSPDVLILFTNTVSHKMVRTALEAIDGKDVPIIRCHSSSLSALKRILETEVSSVLC
ncbi:MAG: DUF2325 domain-containing protein [Erysipelotrichaceae bacterium]